MFRAVLRNCRDDQAPTMLGWGGGLKTAMTRIMGEAVKSKGNVVYDFFGYKGA